MSDKFNFLIDGNHFDKEFENKNNDIEFYKSMAGETPVQVLELGVGTGRVAIPLAQAGHAITGVDFSESMLTATANKARAAGVEISLSRHDIRDYQPMRPYERIFCPVNTFAHFSGSEAQAILQTVFLALTDSGLFVLDIPNPQKYLDPEIYSKTYSTQYPNPDGSGLLFVSTELKINGNQLTIERNYMSENRTAVSKERMTMYFFMLEHWISALKSIGFKIKEVYGDHQKDTYEKSSPSLLIVCEK